jgi:hypothetical protein
MALHGKTGNIQVDDVDLVNIQNWSLSEIGETGETTSMGDAFGTHLVGLTDFNATAEGKVAKALDTIALLGIGDVDANFVLDDGAGEYSGGVIVTGFTETAVVDDVIGVSYTLEGDDQTGLVYAASGDAAVGAADAIHGKSISAEFGVTPTAFTDVRGWTVTGSVPVSDASVAHATLHGRQKLAGVKAVTATVTILTPATDLPVRAGDAPFALNLSRTATLADGEYQGTAIFTGSEAGVDVTGTEITQLSFLYTGTVALAVA